MNIKNVLVLGLFFLSCGVNRSEKEIDLKKSEEIIPFMNNLSINRLELLGGDLIINDTLLHFISTTPDSLQNTRWIAHQMEVKDWVVKRNINLGSMTDLKDLMNRSNNHKVVKEKEAYFFSEGSWIDANWGKVYSKWNITSEEADLSFERVKEIKALDDRPNWYEYYAD